MKRKIWEVIDYEKGNGKAKIENVYLGMDFESNKNMEADSFQSEANIRYPEDIANDIKNGKAYIEERGLLEDED